MATNKKSESPEIPGAVFYTELLRSLREDIHKNRVSTDDLANEIRALNSICHELVDELRLARGRREGDPDRRVSERPTSAGRRLSDRKGSGEKQAARRK